MEGGCWGGQVSYGGGDHRHAANLAISWFNGALSGFS